MNIEISGKTRNYIFIAILGLAMITFIVGYSLAVAQDKEYKDQYIRYQQATGMMMEGRFAEAQVIFTQLDQGFGDSYQVLYKLGICSGGTGDHIAAINYMHRAQATRPALVTDQEFLVKYGQFAFMQGDYGLAKAYLLESKKYNSSPEATKEAEGYLQEIESQEKSGR